MADYTVDFSPIARLPQIRRDAILHDNRNRLLSELGNGANINDVAMALGRAGDIQGLTALSQLGFRQDEARRAQSNADRAFEFQKQQAERPVFKEVDDGAGGKALVRVSPQSSQAERVPIAGQEATPQNPFVMGKMNESQSKDALYASRMFASEKVLRGVEQIGTSALERIKSGASEVTGYNMRGPEFQKFDQARRDFINATLRRESGAVISPSEFDNANKQYFPMPGDNADTIKQKRLNRAEAMRGIAAGAGPGYRPESVFDANGNIVPNPAPSRSQPKKGISKTEYDALPSGAKYIAPDGSERTKR